jgi:hypothetical protein
VLKRSQGRGVSDGELAAAIFLVVGVAYWVALPYVDIQGSHPVSDGSIYAAMATHPRDHISVLFGGTNLKDALPVPFVWRVFTPWTVWTLPFGTATGFKLVNVVAVAGSATALFLYARTFFDRAAAFRAVAYFVLAGDVLILLMDPWLVDGPALFFSILSFYLVRRDRVLWATLTLCLGVTVHESLVIVVATLAFVHMAGRDWRIDWRLVPFVGFPVLVYVVIHYTSLLYGSTLTYQFWSAENRQAVIDTRRHLDGSLDKSLLFAFATSFGAVWILAAIGSYRAPKFLRAGLIMLPALMVAFLSASDWDRVLTVAFPIVILLACRVRLRWSVLVALLFVQAWTSGLAINRITGYYRDDPSRLHTDLTLALLGLAIALVGVGALIARRGPPDSRMLHSVKHDSSET